MLVDDLIHDMSNKCQCIDRSIRPQMNVKPYVRSKAIVVSFAVHF